MIKNSILLAFLLILSSFFLTSCADRNANIVFKKPDFQPLRSTRSKVNNLGALYSSEGTSLFADKKNLQIGDIIQVKINESLISESKNSKDTSKTSNSQLGGGKFSSNTPAGSSMNKFANNLNNKVGLGFKSNTNNAFSGKTDQKFNETLNSKISVVIEQAYENGNYYIQGSKEILIDGDKQKMTLSGIIRPYDISPDNSIPSSQIAELKVKITKKGEEDDNLKRSWGSKFLEDAWPF